MEFGNYIRGIGDVCRMVRSYVGRTGVDANASGIAAVDQKLGLEACCSQHDPRAPPQAPLGFRL